MRIIVCIGNNLKYDTRVKRHVKAIANYGHDVHVIASPVPDFQYGLKEQENMTHTFFEYKPQEAPINTEIMDFAKRFNLQEIFLNSFPILECSSYYNPPDLKHYTEKLNHLVQGMRWRDITSRISEEMSDEKALSYPLSFFEKSVQFAEAVLTQRGEVILCNDEDTLLAGVAHKMKYNSRLIYDFHDLMADISDGVFPQMYSNVLAIFEKQMIQYADVVMSVSKAELVWSKRHYGFHAPAIPVLNCSESGLDIKNSYHKNNVGKKIRIYYHGMCDHSRGLFELITALKQFAEFVLVLRCLPSDVLTQIKQKISDEQLDKKVFFVEPVGAEEIPEMANKDGDIGFAFCKTEDCLNWQFALQNKFIEYIKGGLPVITSATEEQGRIVIENDIGWVLDENNVDGIVKTLKLVLKDRDRITDMSRRSLLVAEKLFNWKKYDEILNGIILADRKVIKEHTISDPNNRRELRIWKKEDLKNGHIQKRRKLLK